MFDKLKREGLIETFYWSKYTTVDPVIRTKHLISKDLSLLIKYAYLSFYVNLRFLIKRLSEWDVFLIKKILKEAPKTFLRTVLTAFNKRFRR